MVAINHFVLDTKSEIKIIFDFCKKLGVEVSECTHWAEGGKGTKDLAKKVVKTCKKFKKNNFKFLYSEKESLWNKIEKIAKKKSF